MGGGGNNCRRPRFPPSSTVVLTLLFSLSLFLCFSFVFPATFYLISPSLIAGHNLSPSDGGRTWLIKVLALLQQHPINFTSEALANLLLSEPVTDLHHPNYFLSLRFLNRSRLKNLQIWPRLDSTKILPAEFQRLCRSFLKLCYRFLQICRSELVSQVTITSGMAGHSHTTNIRGRTLTAHILQVDRIYARTIHAFGNIFSNLLEAVKFNHHLSWTNSFKVSSTFFLDKMASPLASTQQNAYLTNVLGLIPKEEYIDQDASSPQRIHSPTGSFFFIIYNWRSKRKASFVDLSLSSKSILCPSKTGDLVIKRQTGIMSPSRLRSSRNLTGSLSGWPATEHNLQKTIDAARNSGVRLGFSFGKVMGLKPVLLLSGPYWTEETFNGSHLKVKLYICLVKILKISSKPYLLDWRILKRTFNSEFKNLVTVNHRTWIRSWLPPIM